LAPLFLVVDQNQLRSESLRVKVLGEPQTRFVLPDLAMFEMAKSTNRELTLKLSLEILAQDSGRVFVSRALSDCLQYELQQQNAVVGHLIDRDGTKFLRKLLTAVASKVPNAEFEQVISDPEGHVAGLRRDYLDHDANKSRSVELVEETKRGMSTEFAKRVRGSKATFEEKLDFIYEKAPSLLVGVLEDNEFSRGKAVRLLRQRPMLLRYFYLKLWACLCWEEQGRIEGLGPPKVSNDLIDHEYVLAATFFSGVLSDEPAVNEAYRAVTHLLARA